MVRCPKSPLFPGNLWLFFFFKQKTAYEILRSDWSSDVCSSDLREGARQRCRIQHGGQDTIAGGAGPPLVHVAGEYPDVGIVALQLGPQELELPFALAASQPQVGHEQPQLPSGHEEIRLDRAAGLPWSHGQVVQTVRHGRLPREQQVAVAGIAPVQGGAPVRVHVEALGQVVADRPVSPGPILDLLQGDEVGLQFLQQPGDALRREAPVPADAGVHVVADDANAPIRHRFRRCCSTRRPMRAMPAAAITASTQGSNTGSPASAARARSTLKQMSTVPGPMPISVPSRKSRSFTRDAPASRLMTVNGAMGMSRRPARDQGSDERPSAFMRTVTARGTRPSTALPR